MSRRSSHHDMDTLPSATAPRRLSKPRVQSTTSKLNRSTSSLFSEPNGSPPIPTKRPDASLALSRMSSSTPASESQARRGSRPEMTPHLYSIKYEDTVAEPDDRQATAGAARGVRERLSRTSMLLHNRASVRLSFSPLTKSSSGLSLLQESAVPDEDPDVIREQIRERVCQDTLAALQRVQSTGSDDVESPGMVPAYRRRSLLTPGLATRNPSDMLARPPEPSPSPPLATHESPRHVVHPSDEFPPLTKLAALSHSEWGRSSPIPRATTPALANYDTLGGLGLGTLRITNGNDSPTLSPVAMSHARRPSTAPKRHDDWSGPADARRSTSIGRVALADLTRSRGNSMGGRSAEEHIDPRQVGGRGPSTATADRAAPVRSDPPPKADLVPIDSSEDEGLQMAVSVKLRKRRAFSLPPRAAKASPGPSTVDVSLMPVLPSPHASTEGFEATSKAPFDFDDDSVRESARNSAVDGSLHTWTSFIEDAEHQRPHAESFGEEIMRELSRVASLDVERPLAEREETSQSNSTVLLDGLRRSNAISTDSGYGSGASLTSFSGKARADGMAKTPSAASKRSSRSSLWFGAAKAAPDQPPAERERGRGRLSFRAPFRAVPGASSTNRSVQSVKHEHAHEHEGRPVATAPRVPSQSPGRRKLQKSRPTSMPPPKKRSMAASSHEIAPDTIPPLPVDVVKRHSQRLSRYAVLDHPCPSPQHPVARTEARPIVGAPLRFPSPTRTRPPDKTTKGDAHRHGEADEGAESKRLTHKSSIFTSLRRLSWSSSKRHPKPDSTAGPTAPPVPALGTVIDALGDSPYDGARSRAADRSLMGRSSRAQQPYQATATSTTLRPRHQVRLADEQAAELARLRSNDLNRHLGGVAVDRGSSSSSGGASSKPSRTRSMFAEAPPVPAMPSSFQVPKRDGYPGRKSFERSLRGDTSTNASTNVSANTSMQSLHARPLNYTPRGSSTHLPSTYTHLPSLSSHHQHSPSETPIRRRSVALPDSDEDDSHDPGHEAPGSQGSTQRLSGRFDGGYLFGYQKGTGVGGSAGTRARGSKASRKSGLMSREFGVDLSDVPVFVAMAT